jgi:hypothetical protein
MVRLVLRPIRGAPVSGREEPIELEVHSDRFVVTAGLARLLMVLARRHIESERAQQGQSERKEPAA